MDAKTSERLGPLDYSEPDAEEMNRNLFRLMVGINAQAFRAFGDKVIQGPFAGMVIPVDSPWDDGNSSTKLLGTYEHELHDAIMMAAWRRPAFVINVGCAEGYYAIGMARMLPAAKVVAIDKHEPSLAMCRDYVKRNGVENVIVTAGVDDAADLDMVTVFPRGHRLYLVDVEGAELSLLDPDKCGRLVNSDIIVECHDFLDRDISYTLAERFGTTHRVDMVRPQLPNLDGFKFLRSSPAVFGALMVLEKRPMPSCWLACWSNRKG